MKNVVEYLYLPCLLEDILHLVGGIISHTVDTLMNIHHGTKLIVVFSLHEWIFVQHTVLLLLIQIGKMINRRTKTDMKIPIKL